MQTKTLIWVGILIGLFMGAALAATTFNPGDAGKVSDGVTFGSPSGTNITLTGETNVSMGDMYPNSTTHSSQFDNRSIIFNTTQGNITFASDNSVNATINKDEIEGTWTNVTSISTQGNTLEVYPSDKQRVDISGEANTVNITSMSVGDGNTDFFYSGPDDTTVTVKIYDLPANTVIAASDAADGSYLHHNTTDANGNLTLNLPASSHNVELLNADSTSEAVHTEADPTGLISDTPNELSIQVNDSDFPTDDVEVNISLDGSQIHSENITSNGTVTTSNFGTLDLGDHTWWVNSTDAYGNTNNTKFTFSLPSNITLRNETNASQVIKDKNITVTFYSTTDDTIIIERSDSNEDGNISLRGLPDTPFVITFEGNGSWYDRRAYIDSIGQQQNMYLLNATAFPTADDEAIETTFVYEDRTGEFSQGNTTLEIERGVDPDNDDNFSWEVMAGDFWGAAGEFPFTGEYQARYRLRITNQETGETRLLGTHIPTADGVKNIIVGDIIFDAENATGRYFNAGINPNTSNLQIYYQDLTDGTTDLEIVVYEQGNKSNEIYNNTVAGPIGTTTVSVSLTSDQVDKNWIVTYDGTNDDDGSISGQTIVGGAQYPINMDPAILAALGYTLITFVMALYGPRVSIMGAWAGVAVFGGLMFIGWLDWSIAALTIAVLAAAGGTFYKEAMPS